MAESPQAQVPQPRATMSAYACFVKHFCSQVQSTGGQQSVILSTDLSKVASERWKGMTNEEKKPYKELSIQEKARLFQQDKTQILRQATGAVVTSSTTTGRKRKLAARKNKNPNAPKRATTAFFFFAQVERPKVRAEHPEYKVTEVSKELGKMWGKMKPEDKEKYEKLAAEDRERYNREMDKYNVNPYQENRSSESEEEDQH